MGCDTNVSSDYFNNNDYYTIAASDTTIALPIDDRTKTYTFALHYFEDSSGVDYVSLENEDYDSRFGIIHYYRLDSLKIDHTVKLNYEGPDHVSYIEGHTTLDDKELMVSCDIQSIMYKVGHDGKIHHIYPLFDSINTHEKYLPETFMSMFYNPLYCIDGKYYVPLQLPPHHLFAQDNHVVNFDECPLMLVVDSTSGYIECSKLTFPKLYDKITGSGHINEYSRIYDGKRFVYSFFGLDSLYVSYDLISFKTFYAKSKFVSVKNTSFRRGMDVMEKTKLCHIRPRYGNIVYDKYRDLYYRFCYCYDEIVADKDFAQVLNTNYLLCHGEFTIQIIDSDFNLLGESKFPRGKYVPMLFFVNKSGLWLSENNDERPNLSEDLLVFRCFKVIENE